jgi:hypothetical protein
MFLASFGLVLASTLKVAAWSASSTAVPPEGINYDAGLMGDAKQSTVWVEGEEGAGLGAWIAADFGGDKTVDAFTVWGGNWYDNEHWQHFNRPKLLIAEYADGSTEEFTLADEFKPQVVRLATPKRTTSIKFRLKSVYKGKGVDTAISEIRFTDGARSEAAVVSAVTASSTFPPDTDGDYDPDNAADGIVDSMWCEGNKAGDGKGEWLRFEFAAPTSISRVKIRNGSSYSPALFMKGNRASGATLQFSDGATETVSFKDIMFDQTFTFAAHNTTSVKLTVTGVKKGSEYNDLCISEATFLP